jgi:hypothetical protein
MAVDDAEAEGVPQGKGAHEHDNRTPSPVAVGAHRDGREQENGKEESDESDLDQTSCA